MKTLAKLLPFLPTIALNVFMLPGFGSGTSARAAGKSTGGQKQKISGKRPAKLTNEQMLELVQRATFQWFKENNDPTTGLVYDRTNREHVPATIAGTGFGLTVFAIGSARGWITRKEAAAYTLKVLTNLNSTPQGPQAQGVSGCEGYFYHFLDPKTGLRATAPEYWNSELSSIDTALLMAGVLFARNYYDLDDLVEFQIRATSDALYDRVNWPWLLKDDLTLGHGYTPESGMIPYTYKGYSEAVLLYILAASSRTHPVPAESWKAFIGNATVQQFPGYSRRLVTLPGMPLFTYQYPMSWLDFRGIFDDLNRRLGFDYFENSRRATKAQWLYAWRNPTGMRGYSKFDWGLTASDGPASEKKTVDGKTVEFRAYSERGAPGGFDDGTIAPTAAVSSIVYAPSIVLPTIRHWLKDRPELFGENGFVDAFNPTYDQSKPSGWVDGDRLSIDQGPIVLMIENYRSGLVWQVMRKDWRLKEGLRHFGFSGGWLK